MQSLAPDREEAGERYEFLRLKLLEYFYAQICQNAEDLADETLNRVARKLTEGVTIASIPAYCHGVARMVRKEYVRDPASAHLSLEDLPGIAAPLTNDPEQDPCQQCFDRCLQSLKPQERTLLLTYYHHENALLHDARKEMTGRLKLSSAALRIRVHRLKGRLENCISRCLNTPAKKS